MSRWKLPADDLKKAVEDWSKVVKAVADAVEKISSSDISNLKSSLVAAVTTCKAQIAAAQVTYAADSDKMHALNEMDSQIDQLVSSTGQGIDYVASMAYDAGGQVSGWEANIANLQNNWKGQADALRAQVKLVSDDADKVIK